MSSAIAVAGLNGEVICLDKGNYGSGPIITQSVTISCGDGLWENNGGGAVIINAPGGANVYIEGLVADGMGSTSGSAIGFNGQGTLHLHRVRVGNRAGATGEGLSFLPSSGVGILHVSDSIFYSNTAKGIAIRPGASASAQAHIRNTIFERNGQGVHADGSTSTLGVLVNIDDSVFSGNSGNGVVAFSSASKAPVQVAIKSSKISGNFGAGLLAQGAAASGAGSAQIAVGGSMITGNWVGLSPVAPALIISHGNNQLFANISTGAFSGNIGLQ